MSVLQWRHLTIVLTVVLALLAGYVGGFDTGSFRQWGW
jgi:hypothetical protein